MERRRQVLGWLGTITRLRRSPVRSLITAGLIVGSVGCVSSTSRTVVPPPPSADYVPDPLPPPRGGSPASEAPTTPSAPATPPAAEAEPPKLPAGMIEGRPKGLKVE